MEEAKKKKLNVLNKYQFLDYLKTHRKDLTVVGMYNTHEDEIVFLKIENKTNFLQVLCCEYFIILD